MPKFKKNTLEPYLDKDIRIKTLDGYLNKNSQKQKRVYLTLGLIFLVGLINYSYNFSVDNIKTNDNSIDDSKEMFNIVKNVTNVLPSFFELRALNNSNKYVFEPDLDTIRKKQKSLPTCHQNSHKVTIGSHISITYTNQSLRWIDNVLYHQVHKGGFYTPKRCQSRHKIVIILPYRERENDLKTFLVNLHPYLMKQELEYRIFVIEQVDSSPFNIGRLYNAGFLESQHFGDYQCLILHEVDLLPLNYGIMYTCPILPRHMSATIYKQMAKYIGLLQRKSPSIFGGVTALTPKQFQKVNGFSNFYWGLQGVDHDLYWRLKSKGYQIVRYNKTIAEYMELFHTRTLSTRPTKLRWNLLRTARKRVLEDGLSTLQYKVINITRRHLFTHIKVNINPSNEDLKSVEAYLKNIFL